MFSLIHVISRKKPADTMPMPKVAHVGVKYFEWIRANLVGIARYTAIDSAVRAVGRIVVWVEAAAEVRIEIASRSRPTLPSALSPYSVGPIALNTSAALSALPNPIPARPTPANPTAAVDTST